MNKKIVVAGHICLDITPVIPESKSMADLLPGKLLQTTGVNVSTGGAVANVGLALKKLGADPILMGKVGCDEFGDMICSILKKYDAESGIIRSEGEQSSYSVVLALPGTDRIFLHCPGANDTFVASDVKEEDLKDAALFHFGYPPIMEKMFEEGGKELTALMKKVKSFGILTSLDMTAIDPDSKAGHADWKAIIASVMPYLDFFVPSIEELCFMLDRKRFDSWQERACGKDITEILDLETDIKPLANICMDMGAKVLLLKCGSKGLYLKTSKDAPIWQDVDIFAPSFKPERILSATGAGDTSIAAFLTAAVNGETAEMALDLATATGALCVSSYDALSGLLTLDEIKEKINKGWERNAC